MWYRKRRYNDDGEEVKPKKPDKTALMTAADLLARQEQSEKKLKEKLLRKGYEEDEAQQALATLKERHYLDDEEACARQFEFLYNESTKSVKQITIKLMQRGFPAPLVKECVPQDTFEREKAVCLRLLQMKFKPDADKQKMMANLYRKGFDSSAIRTAVAKFIAAEE